MQDPVRLDYQRRMNNFWEFVALWNLPLTSRRDFDNGAWSGPTSSFWMRSPVTWGKSSRRRSTSGPQYIIQAGRCRCLVFVVC